jgi:hypothetical protein
MAPTNMTLGAEKAMVVVSRRELLWAIKRETPQKLCGKKQD